MYKAGASSVCAVILILFTVFPAVLAAQENNDDPAVEPDWEVYVTDLYVAGDQTFIISLGTVFPTVFYDNEGIIDHQLTPPVGGTLALGYNYYLHPRFFLGGEVSGMIIYTLRQNPLFIVPLGVKLGTQFIAGRFEFPIHLSLGMIWHTYLDLGYYGFYMNTGAAAFFRATNDWSFGLTAQWCWYPEWSKHPVDGHFVYTMLSARYHF